MNANLFRGKWDEFKVELKKEWGRFTDDDLEKVQGEYDKFMRAVQALPGPTKRGPTMDEWYSVVQFPAAP